MTRALVSVSIVCALAAPAVARPSTTVFPLLAPNLPIKIASAPEVFSKALATELEGKVAPLPIDDAAALQGCDHEATTCLESVSKAYKSKRIVFGQITMVDEDRLKVTLTRFDPAGPDRQQRTFTLEGSVDDMAEELVKLSRPLFGGEDVPVDSPPPPPDAGVTDHGDGTISSGTYVIAATGAVSTAIGIGFLISAFDLADQVNAAPRNSSEDFEKLVTLEDKGAQRMLIGSIATTVGGVALIYGAYRWWSERHEGASTSASVARRLMPVPVRGGAAMVFTMELP